MSGLLESRYTGLLTALGPVPRRPHDPDVSVFAGAAVPAGQRREALHVGGASLAEGGARMACFGEALERLAAEPARTDDLVGASAAELGDAAIAPQRWRLFSRDQHATEGFPFAPFDAATETHWTRCRVARDGASRLVPTELVYLDVPFARRIAPGVSTGLAAGRTADDAALRGLREQLERDAVASAWAGGYALERLDGARAFAALGEPFARRVRRPNLRYGFFRIRSPFSDAITLVTLEGEDHEGACFSIGSACRETLRASLEKAVLEAIQGRFYVRALLAREPASASERARPDEEPRTFEAHAAYYTRNPARLAETPLASAREGDASALLDPRGAHERAPETFETLVRRLGPERPVLLRLMTPSLVSRELPGWVVVRVLVPGLTPLHGAHALAHLASPAYGGRSFAAHRASPPHPFP